MLPIKNNQHYLYNNKVIKSGKNKTVYPVESKINITEKYISTSRQRIVLIFNLERKLTSSLFYKDRLPNKTITWMLCWDILSISLYLAPYDIFLSVDENSTEELSIQSHDKYSDLYGNEQVMKNIIPWMLCKVTEVLW